MNFYALIGLIGALGAVTLGTVWMAPLVIYLDLVSVMFVVFVTFFMVMATFGAHNVQRVGYGAVRCWLNPAGETGWSPAQHMKAVRFADSGGHLCIFAGAVGTLIGSVQMLQQLDDVSSVGPAMAVAILTLVYPVALYAFFFVPLARYHSVQAGSEGTAAGNVSLNSSVVMLVLAMLALGGTFFIMLVAMGEY